jgi:hypothetical protein
LDLTTERVVTLFAVFAGFFCEAVEARFVTAFFARVFDAADLEGAGFETLRLTDLVAAARFALGRVDFDCTERPFREDFGDDRCAGVCDRDRLMPLVTGLLIRRFKSNGQLDA